MAKEVEKYSINDLEAVVSAIRKETRLQVGEIEQRLGYNPGYISQTRSKGKVSEKLLRSMVTEFREELARHNISIVNKLTTITEKPNFGEKPTTTQPLLVQTVADQAATIKNLSEVILSMIAKPQG